MSCSCRVLKCFLCENSMTRPDVVKSASIEDLKQNPHVQGLLEVLNQITKSMYPNQTEHPSMFKAKTKAEAKLKEWE